MKPNFAHKADIRGQYGIDINDKDGFYLGLAILKTFNPKNILIGWDTRPISKSIADNLLNALKGVNIHISYMDRCPIEFVAASSNAMSFDLSVMVTGSHNNADWTGMIIYLKGGESLLGEKMDLLIENYELVLKDASVKYLNEKIDLNSFKNNYSEFEKLYVEKIENLIPLQKINQFNIVVDVGDGSGRKSLDILKSLLPQVNFVSINDSNNYTLSSSHVADPSNIDNMKDLISHIKENIGEYDCGFAFDSDADRTLLIDEEGNYINGSIVGGILSEMIVKSNKKDKYKFGYAVECGPAFFNRIEKFKDSFNLDVSPVPVGHSLIKSLIRSDNFDFIAENVGHFYYKDFFITDSPVYTILLTLLWLSEGNKLSSVIENNEDGKRVQGFVSVDSYLSTHVDNLINDIKDIFSNIKTFNIDGTRLEIFNNENIIAWCAIRNSLYEKKIKYYFGALDSNDFDKINNIFSSYLK